MSDYKVCYTNHKKFSGNTEGGRKQGSPVRIFTNIELRYVLIRASHSNRNF